MPVKDQMTPPDIPETIEASRKVLVTRVLKAQARIAALEKELDDYKSTGPYEAKALDLVAETLATLSASDWEARGPKLWAVVRNGAEWCRRFEARIAALEQELEVLPKLRVSAQQTVDALIQAMRLLEQIWLHGSARWKDDILAFLAKQLPEKWAEEWRLAQLLKTKKAQADARGREE